MLPGVNSKTFDAIERIKHELTSTNSLILKGSKILVPSLLQSRVIDIAHTGHQGMVKTKSLIREKVWFSGIDAMVEKKVKNCLACQASVSTNQREPLKMSPLPEGPWIELSTDFGQVENGQYIFVVMDEYSRFAVVDMLTSLTANAVIPKLDKIISEYGVPKVIKSDNGPPFNSIAFKKYAENTGFVHRKITPLWPTLKQNVLCELLKKVSRLR